MASSRTPKKSLEEILQAAKKQWLSADELCEIFANIHKLPIFISSEQAKPQVSDGLFFAIKKDKMNSFKKDGIEWRKRKDKNSVQEGHGKLKVKGVEKLHTYYAVAVQNKYFKRRIYRMIEGDPLDIVIFHYREDKEDFPNLDSPGSSPENLPLWSIEAITVAIERNMINLWMDKNGWTALHWAAHCGRQNTVEFLISNGAAPGIRSNEDGVVVVGKTPADLAFAAGHKGVGDYLEKQEESWLAPLAGTY